MPKRRFIWHRLSKKVILDIQNNNFGYPKINIYFGYQKLFFWISEISYFWYLEFFLDIWNSCASISDITNSFLDIRNKFLEIWKTRINVNSGYLKLLFLISRIIISDIRNYAEKAFYLRYPKKVILDIKNNNFRYPKINIYFGYQK